MRLLRGDTDRRPRNDTFKTISDDMKIGIGFNGIGIPLREAVTLAAAADRAGLDSVWVAEDAWITGRDAITLLGSIAAVTQQVWLGTNLLPAHHSRHLQLLASTVAALDDLSNHRFILGIGAATKWASYPANAKPLQLMRECITGLRALTAGQEFILNDKPLLLRSREQIYMWDLPPLPDKPPPIYLGGRGPKMTQLAGEIADGLLVELYVAPTEIPERTRELHIGARAAGRDPDTLEVACNIHITVTADGAIDERLRQHMAGWYAARVPKEAIERANLDVQEVERMTHLMRTDGRAAAAAFVTRPMVQNLCVAGIVEECLAKLTEYQAAGVTHAILMPFGGDPQLALQVGVEFKRQNT